MFCICSKLPLLCTGCRSVHDTKPDFHFPLPVHAYGPVNSHNQLEMKLWLIRLKSSQEKLRQNMQSFDQCRADIQSTSLNMQRELVAMTELTMQTLEGLRAMLGAEIEQAVQETSENAYRSDYQPQTYLAGLIWQDCHYPSAEPLPVFTYAVQTETSVKDCLGVSFHTSVPHLSGFNCLSNPGNEELQTKLREAELLLQDAKSREYSLMQRQEDLQTQLNQAQLLLEEGKSRENSPPAPQVKSEESRDLNTQLVFVNSTTLRYFDLQTDTWLPMVTLSQRIWVDPCSVWVVLKEGGVFVCCRKQAWVVSRSGGVLCERDMREWRSYPGVVALPDHPVLIFGGNLQSGRGMN